MTITHSHFFYTSFTVMYYYVAIKNMSYTYKEALDEIISNGSRRKL